MHVAFDIDGTLIDEMTELLRPDMQTFIDFCFDNFNSVNIWTAASKEWCHEVIRMLQPYTAGRHFSTIFCGDRCIGRVDHHEDGYYTIRKICKSTTTRHNTIIVDDTPSTFSRNYANAVYIKTYSSRLADTDRELLRVIDVCKSIIEQYAICGSVRQIQRPRWHTLFTIIYRCQKIYEEAHRPPDHIGVRYLLRNS